MRRWLTLLILFALLAVGVGAAAAANSPLKGEYQATIKGKVSLLDGTWLVSFAANGAYTVVKEPKTSAVLIGGTSKLSGKTVVMVDKAGPLACQGAGKYTWTRQGKKLRLAKVRDGCPGRVAVLTTSAYTKVG